jgi:hypothetical protein
MVRRAIALIEAASTPALEVWNYCRAVHEAVDGCRPWACPGIVHIENRLYWAAMAREGATFKSKAARAFRDMAGKDRLAALKKDAAVVEFTFNAYFPPSRSE